MFGSVFGQRIRVIVRNGLEHGIPGFERIALGFGVAAAEKNRKKKTRKDDQLLAKMRHRRPAYPAWLNPHRATDSARHCSNRLAGRAEGGMGWSIDRVIEQRRDIHFHATL